MTCNKSFISIGAGIALKPDTIFACTRDALYLMSYPTARPSFGRTVLGLKVRYQM